MRKFFIYIIISLFLFTPIAYSGFWYFSLLKAKNFLVEALSYINNDDKSDISNDFSGFPSNLIFHIKNPKFSNEQFTISSEALLIKNRLLDRSLYIYMPSNEVNIAIHGELDNEKKNIKCTMDNNNRFVIKLNNLPSSSQFDRNTIIDYVNALRYEDYGLKCDISNDSQAQKIIATEINEKGNHIQFNLNKELNENAKLGFDFYIYRYKNSVNPEDYLSIETKFDYEFVTDISTSSINFDIEKFFIQSNEFSFAANGGIHNYNLVTSSFKDKINVNISNYKELASFMVGEEFSENYPKTSNAFRELISSLSEKTIDDNVQFTIRYDNDIGSSFIGKLSIAGFMDQLNKINQLTKDESSS